MSVKNCILTGNFCILQVQNFPVRFNYTTIRSDDFFKEYKDGREKIGKVL